MFEKLLPNKYYKNPTNLFQLASNDQKTRFFEDGRMNIIDKENQEKILEIIKNKGWDYLLKNKYRLFASWIIFQHFDNDPEKQKEFIFTIKKAIKNNEIKWYKELQEKDKITFKQSIAMIIDRFLTNKYGVQFYGSQFRQINDQLKLVPILKNEKYLKKLLEEKIEKNKIKYLELDNNTINLINERRKGVFNSKIEKIQDYIKLISK